MKSLSVGAFEFKLSSFTVRVVYLIFKKLQLLRVEKQNITGTMTNSYSTVV